MYQFLAKNIKDRIRVKVNQC